MKWSLLAWAVTLFFVQSLLGWSVQSAAVRRDETPPVNNTTAGQTEHCRLNNPCHNAGQCLFQGNGALPGHYQCVCRQGFEGEFCQKAASPCASNPCQNGGQCKVVESASYQCHCQLGFTGTTCTIEWLTSDKYGTLTESVMRMAEDMKEMKVKVESSMQKDFSQIQAFLSGLEQRLVTSMNSHLSGVDSKMEAFSRDMTSLSSKMASVNTTVISLSSNVQSVDMKVEALKQNISSSPLQQNGGCQLDGDWAGGYCETTLDDGRWRLVWKHSYLQVSLSDLQNAKTFSQFSKPCLDLSDGWCNVPNKQLPGATEQMIVAYHNGLVVYAYKSPLNPQLGKTEFGGRLTTGWKKVVDKCSNANGVQPDITRFGTTRGQDLIWGIAFDKVTPLDINDNCDTVHSSYGDCRWHDCLLPSSISPRSYNTQMTMAIFVR